MEETSELNDDGWRLIVDDLLYIFFRSRSREHGYTTNIRCSIEANQILVTVKRFSINYLI